MPLLLPWLYLSVGWQWAFLLTGASGFVWLAAWLAYYRLPGAHPRVSAAELAYHIQENPPASNQPSRRGGAVAAFPIYGYVSAKFLTDAVWHWYLYLLPFFISTQFKMSKKEFWLPLVVV